MPIQQCRALSGDMETWAGVEWGLVWSGGWCAVGAGVEWGLVCSGGCYKGVN